MAFSGYLLKCGTTELPMKYIRHESYTVTPDQRLELDAKRDATGVLHRTTVANMPPKIEFETIYLTNAEVAVLNTIISNAYSVSAERKLPITYYDPETDTYKTTNAYLPDVEYKIDHVDVANNKILYQPIRYAFIGY